MILQRTGPPLLETPFEVFDQGVFTPNDRFYVRWHLPNIPTTIEPADFQLKVHGHVRQPLSLTLHDLVHDFPSFACWRTGKTRPSRLRRSVALPMPTHYAAPLRVTWA
jgi:hypothetical protein